MFKTTLYREADGGNGGNQVSDTLDRARAHYGTDESHMTLIRIDAYLLGAMEALQTSSPTLPPQVEQTIDGINLYQEMNEKIKEFLKMSDEPMCRYAASRIKQLEKYALPQVFQKTYTYPPHNSKQLND